MIERMFFSIGASKAGTTWLYEQFKDHPDIYFPREKEIHYFFSMNNGFNRLKYTDRYDAFHRYVKWNKSTKLYELERDIYWFMRYLRGPVDDYWYEQLFIGGRNKKYSADFSNTTSLLDKAGWEHIRLLVHEPKIVYTLREPAARLWSHLKFHLRWIGEEHLLSTWQLDEFVDYSKKPFLALDGQYVNNIKRMKEVMDEDNYSILFFEDARGNPQQELNKIESFLCVEPRQYEQESLEKVVNRSFDVSIPDDLKEVFREQLNKEYTELENMGFKLPTAWMS